MSDYDEENERPSFGGGGLGSGRASGMRSGFGPGHRRIDEEPGDGGPKKKAKLQYSAAGAKASGTSSFAAKMMANMGWKEGQGLGAHGRGRLAPIETQLRPQGAGLGAVKEKTKQAKEEEKRAAAFRGENIEDSSEEERKMRRKLKEARRKGAGASGSATPGGASTRRKPKYTTAEEVRAELQGLNIPSDVLESAFALTGEGMQPLAAMGGFTSAQSSAVPAETQASKAAKRMRLELLACAETRHALNDKKVHLQDATGHLVDGIDNDRAEISQTQDMLAAITKLQDLDLGDRTKDQATAAWEDVTRRLEAIELNFKNELDKYGVHEVAVAAIHPLFRIAMIDWEPLENPTYLVSYLESLKHVLGIETDSDAKALALQGDFHTGHRNRKSTTPYETMIYTLWRPRVRATITNKWNVEDPRPLTALFESWRPLLPMFVYANLVDQILIPKLLAALASWKPSRSSSSKRRSPHSQTPDQWIFPWLPYLPDRHLNPKHEGLLAEVKRKIRSVLSSHNVEAGVPQYLLPWKSLLGKYYSEIITTRLLPRIASYLAKTLIIDPSDQDPVPLTTALSYASLFPPTTMAHLLAAEFFPKFHAVLYQWLISTPNYGEIEEWYSWWKSQIPPSIRDIPPLDGEWTKAFTSMGLAMDLGDRAAAELPAPDSTNYHPNSMATAVGIATSTSISPARPARTSADLLPELTFRDVVEEWCAENDLLLVALREAHDRTGAPLWRITASADQKGGVPVYLRGDVLWARSKKDRGVWEPLGLGEELVARASGR